MCSSPSGAQCLVVHVKWAGSSEVFWRMLQHGKSWNYRPPLSQWAIIRQTATVILIGCQREHMAGLITCFHRVDRETSSTKNTQQLIKMCVTLKVEDGETHWIRLNNRQQNGLLAASAGHRNHLHVLLFVFLSKKYISLSQFIIGIIMFQCSATVAKLTAHTHTPWRGSSHRYACLYYRSVYRLLHRSFED